MIRVQRTQKLLNYNNQQLFCCGSYDYNDSNRSYICSSKCLFPKSIFYFLKKSLVLTFN